ncbi:MAG: sugar phosphate isomerase/epimerase, partial [Acidobacteria bacterium]|nr:sugar phosphate isomerase/epimerase [Acidobacteriota bacterium]
GPDGPFPSQGDLAAIFSLTSHRAAQRCWVLQMKLAFTVATPDTADLGMLALRGDLEENFRFLAGLGYQGVELMVRDPSHLDASWVREVADKLGLGFAAVSTGQLRKEDGLELSQLDSELRAKAVARGKQVIEFASRLGTQVNIGTYRGRLAQGEERTASLAAARESFGILLDYASERDVTLAIEPQNRSISNWLNCVNETLAWKNKFPHPNLKLLFDVYHALLEEPSLYASLIRAFPATSLVQLSDSNRMAPGSGQLHFGDLLRVLAALGYEGFLCVEILQVPNSHEAATQAARYLKPLLEQIQAELR